MYEPVRERQSSLEVAAGTVPAEAARRVGYSPRCASVTASELMAREDVRTRIELTRTQLLAEAGYDPVSVQTLMQEQEQSPPSVDRVRAAEVLLKLGGYFDEGRPEPQLHLHAALEQLSTEDLKLLAAGLGRCRPGRKSLPFSRSRHLSVNSWR